MLVSVELMGLEEIGLVAESKTLVETAVIIFDVLNVALGVLVLGPLSVDDTEFTTDEIEDAVIDRLVKEAIPLSRELRTVDDAESVTKDEVVKGGLELSGDAEVIANDELGEDGSELSGAFEDEVVVEGDKLLEENKLDAVVKEPGDAELVMESGDVIEAKGLNELVLDTAKAELDATELELMLDTMEDELGA